jgi:hypothetical protein
LPRWCHYWCNRQRNQAGFGADRIEKNVWGDDFLLALQLIRDLPLFR